MKGVHGFCRHGGWFPCSRSSSFHPLLRMKNRVRRLGLLREFFCLWRKSHAGFLGFAQAYEGAALDSRRDFVPFETRSGGALAYCVSSFAFGENRLRGFWALPRPTRALPSTREGTSSLSKPILEVPWLDARALSPLAKIACGVSGLCPDLRGRRPRPAKGLRPFRNPFFILL